MQYHATDETGVQLSAGPRIGLVTLSLISIAIALVIAPDALGMFSPSFHDWTWIWFIPIAALPLFFVALGLAAGWDAFTGVGRRWTVFGGLLLVDIVVAMCVGFVHFFA